jgi:hypothetical protein
MLQFISAAKLQVVTALTCGSLGLPSPFAEKGSRMRVKQVAPVLLGVLGFSVVTVANAQEVTTPVEAPAQPRVAIYGGFGSAETGGDTPWSIGAYFRSPDDLLLGIDLAGEGSSSDSTFRQGGSSGQGWSLNALVGRNLVNSGGFQIDAALLLGAREDRTYCPGGQSYLGYQCYADSDAASEYELNFGAVATVSFQSVMIGVRGTGESTQVILGLKY